MIRRFGIRLSEQGEACGMPSDANYYDVTILVGCHHVDEYYDLTIKALERCIERIRSRPPQHIVAFELDSEVEEDCNYYRLPNRLLE